MIEVIIQVENYNKYLKINAKKANIYQQKLEKRKFEKKSFKR